MFLRWDLTVLWPTTRLVAISGPDRPAASRRSTASSRSVSGSTARVGGRVGEDEEAGDAYVAKASRSRPTYGSSWLHAAGRIPIGRLAARSNAAIGAPSSRKVP